MQGNANNAADTVNSEKPAKRLQANVDILIDPRSVFVLNKLINFDRR